MRTFIGDQPDGERTWQMFVALGDYMARSGKIDDAADAYLAGIDVQDPDVRQADSAAAAAFFNAGRYAESMAHFEAVFEADPVRQTAMRITECAIRMSDFDTAQQWIDEIVDRGWQSSTTELLQANLCERQADALLAAGQEQEATAKFEAQRAAIERAKTLGPAEPLPHIVEATSLLAQYRRTRENARLDEALESLATAARARASSPQIMTIRAEVLKEKGDIDGAIGELERRLELHPTDGATRRQLVQLCMATGRTTRAAEFALEAVDAYPLIPDWHKQLGDVHFARREYDQAIDAYMGAHELRPDDEGILTNLVALMLMQPRSEFGRIINGQNGLLDGRDEMVDESPYLQSAIAVVLCSVGQQEDGLKKLGNAYLLCIEQIEEDPGNLPVLKSWFDNLALIYGPKMSEGEAFVRGLVDHELDVHSSYWLGRAWQRVGSTNGLERASAIFQSALAETDDPGLQESIHRDLGAVRYMRGDCAGAAKSFEEVAALSPGDAGARNNLAYLYATCLDDAQAALPHAEHAVRIAPKNAEFLDTLGTVHLLLDNLDDAETHLRASIEQTATANNHLHLARVLAKTGKRDQAITYLRRASDLNPDPETAREIRDMLDDIQ